MRKSIEPEHGIGHKADEHEAWNTFKRKGVITAASPVFNRAHVPFNLRDMFILGAKVESDLANGCL